MTPCLETTLAGRACRRTGWWKVLGRVGVARCWQHAVIFARRHGNRQIQRLTGGHEVVSVAKVPRRPRRFVTPTTRQQAIACLPHVRTLQELHRVYLFVLEARPPMVHLGDHHDELYMQLLAARARLRAEATDEDYAAYFGRPRDPREVSA